MMFIDGKTHCFGCVFQHMGTVTQENGADFPEQIGCLAGRLEQYEDNGVVLEEAYNEEQNYYVIPGRKCSMDRTIGWAANQKITSIPEWIGLAEEEIMGRMVDVIVLANRWHTKDEVDRFLTLLDNQSWGHPAKVHLVVADENCVPSDYIKLLSKYNFKWKFHHIVDLTMSYGDMINRVGDKCDSFYYAVFDPDFSLPTDFIKRIFERTYRQLKAFSVAEPIGIYSGLIVQSKAHRRVQGNGHEKSAETKIKELVKEQELPHMVIKCEDLLYG
jgi:hypothetical protein